MKIFKLGGITVIQTMITVTLSFNDEIFYELYNTDTLFNVTIQVVLIRNLKESIMVFRDGIEQ